MLLPLLTTVGLRTGDLVRYRQGPERLGIVTMIHITATGEAVCEVIIVQDSEQPSAIGEKKYSHQDYWVKVSPIDAPLDAAIQGVEEEYAEVVELYHTYGES